MYLSLHFSSSHASYFPCSCLELRLLNIKMITQFAKWNVKIRGGAGYALLVYFSPNELMFL